MNNIEEITETELFRRALDEGVDLSQGFSGRKPSYIVPVWNESAPRTSGALSKRVSLYSIIRSDGSAVLLIRCPQHRDESIFRVHTGQIPTPKVPDEQFYVRIIEQHFPEAKGQSLPPDQLIAWVRKTLGWEQYARRMMFW